jgi:hypothetical protein
MPYIPGTNERVLRSSRWFAVRQGLRGAYKETRGNTVTRTSMQTDPPSSRHQHHWTEIQHLRGMEECGERAGHVKASPLPLP